MLKEKREAAGLGLLPEPFYTNDVESKNRILKEQTCYKPQQLPSFVQSMKNMFDDQKQEIDKAVVGLGEYQLCQPYQSYGIDTKVWFMKNEKQRERILDRFSKAELSTPDSLDHSTAPTEMVSTVDHQDGPCVSTIVMHKSSRIDQVFNVGKSTVIRTRRVILH